MHSIQKSDMDLRKMLYQNIVLSGGSTLFKGFGDRLLSEIKKNVSKDMKIRVSFFHQFYWPVYLYFWVFIDRSSTRKTVFNMDGWFNFGISGHI